MSEQIVSSASETENKLIFFYPREKCDYCDRLTCAAIITSGSFEPVCPEHGYSAAYSSTPTARELANQIKTIERYVVWMHDERGRVLLITPIEANSVPGYIAESFEPSSFVFADDAWSVQYEAPGGERKEMHAVWSLQWSQFSLYYNGQLVSEQIA